jgi:hypothetical protein
MEITLRLVSNTKRFFYEDFFQSAALDHQGGLGKFPEKVLTSAKMLCGRKMTALTITPKREVV